MELSFNLTLTTTRKQRSVAKIVRLPKPDPLAELTESVNSVIEQTNELLTDVGRSNVVRRRDGILVHSKLERAVKDVQEAHAAGLKVGVLRDRLQEAVDALLEGLFGIAAKSA